MLKRLTLGFGLIGVAIPLVVIAIDASTNGSYPAWSPYAWPTMIMLMPYGGQAFGLEKMVVAGLSILFNGALYAIVGLVIGAVITRTPREE